MPKDIKGQNYRKGDYLVYVKHSERNDAVILFIHEGPYKKLSQVLKDKVLFVWSQNTNYMSTVKTLRFGAFTEGQILQNWTGMNDNESMLKIPKHMCKPEIKTADIIAFVYLAGYTYTGKPY